MAEESCLRSRLSVTTMPTSATQTQVMSEIVDALSELIEVVTHTSLERETAVEGGTSILDIPDEVLALIFQRHFSYMEISHLKFVCQKFSYVATSVLSSGFSRIQAAIADGMSSALKFCRQTSNESESDGRNTNNKSKIFTLEEYNVLSILLSEYNLLNCMTNFCFSENSFIYSLGFLIDEFMRLLSLINVKNECGVGQDQCLSLITTRMLCDASKYFLDNTLKTCSRADKLQRIELGSVIASVLNCIVNADYRIVVRHNNKTCDIKGLYKLPGYRVNPPIEGKSPIFLAEWLRGVIEEIQDSNVKLLCKRYEEAKVNLMIQIATRREFDSTIDDHLAPFHLGTVNSKCSEKQWTHVIESQKQNERKLTDFDTEINFRLKCNVHESPTFIRKIVEQFQVDSVDEEEASELFMMDVVSTKTVSI